MEITYIPRPFLGVRDRRIGWSRLKTKRPWMSEMNSSECQTSEDCLVASHSLPQSAGFSRLFDDEEDVKIHEAKRGRRMEKPNGIY